MLSLNVASYRVVAGECARAIGAADADALMPLADVSAKVGLVAVSSFAKRATEFGT